MRPTAVLNPLALLVLAAGLAACGGAAPDPLESCEGEACDRIINQMVCGLDDEPGEDEPAATGEGDDGIGSTQQELQGHSYRVAIVIGRDVVEEVGQILERKVREEIWRQGGDLADVDLGGRLGGEPGGRLEGQLKTIAGAFALPLELASLQLEFRVSYSYAQVRSTIVEIVGRLMQTFPYRGKIRWRIGCRVEAERGIVYRRIVGPMIDAALQGFQAGVNEKLRGFLAASGLGDRVTASVAATSSCPATTTLTVSSPSGDFPPYSVSWEQATQAAQKLREILESLDAP